MISIKSPEQIQIIKNAGEIAALALKKALDAVCPGITLIEINNIAESLIVEKGATPGFKSVKNYNFATCINVNEGVVHGRPNNYVIKKGDLITVDLGACYKGFHSDMAKTIEVETNKEEVFLETGKRALEAAIAQCVVGNRLGSVSFAIQKVVENAGYSVSRDLVGHGIGKELHEEPQIPCFGKKHKGPALKGGMVFAIEVIYQKGKPDLVVSDDGWTLETEDRSLAGLFEHTVAITRIGPEILTKG